MYRTCIFCSADLGTNDSVEEFPVGRRLAFDAWKGRLWAVCPKCGRWNLAPIEERWEAVEECERLFRGARLRAHSENVGLAQLPGGTRLVCISAALPREFAAWRYGLRLRWRWRRYLAGTAATAAVSATALLPTPLAALPLAVGYIWILADGAAQHLRARRVIHLPPPAGTPARATPLRRGQITGAAFARTAAGELVLRLHTGDRSAHPSTVELEGTEARSALARLLREANACGAGRRLVAAAVDCITEAGSPEAFLDRAGARGVGLDLPPLESSLHLDRLTRLLRARSGPHPASSPVGSLALEMALHEETERRALEGELALLEAAWREAEEIAGIADTLPDDPLSRLAR